MKPLIIGLVSAGFAISGASFAQEETGQLEEHMHKMHALMEQISNEDSQARRQRLMNEHMELMHEGMNLLAAENPDLAGLTEEQRIEVMERKMEIMQMMMTQMMNHQGEERRGPVHEHKRP